MYYMRQLYRNSGQHYRRISHYIGLARIEMSYITNSGARTWHRMSKIMKYIGLYYWEDLFKTLKKLFFLKEETNPLNYHIMNTEICGKQRKHESIKQILMPKEQMCIQNPIWQEKSWEIRKLANILQWHKDDPHCHETQGEELLPERCRFRRINEDIVLY